MSGQVNIHFALLYLVAYHFVLMKPNLNTYSEVYNNQNSVNSNLQQVIDYISQRIVFLK